MNKQNWKFSSASSSNSTRFKLFQHYKYRKFIETDEDVVHRKYFCVNNHLVSLVELLLEVAY